MTKPPIIGILDLSRGQSRLVPVEIGFFTILLFDPGRYVGHVSLREYAYSNIMKILPPKNENFQIKNSEIYHISAQNIYCGYSLEPPQRGDSNEYPQSMFLSRNKKNNVYPANPSLTI